MKQTAKQLLLRLSFGFLILPFFFQFGVTVAQAHVLKTDGTIGAVLHIDPDDDPIAGSQAGFFFDFKDTTNKFQSSNCTCTATITENGQQIFSQPLFAQATTAGADSPSFFFTFPKRDVYQLVVTGQPNTPNAFQSFTLTYDIRVDRTAPNTPSTTTSTAASTTNHLVPVVIISGIILVLGGFIIVNKQMQNKKKTTQPINKKTADEKEHPDEV